MSERSSFWVGGEYVAGPAGTVLEGQLFVEHLTPSTRNGRPPFVLVHGGGGQGLDYLATPDGRPGWGPLLAERGYDVYVVDRVGHGRSPYVPEVLGPPAPLMDAETLGSLFFSLNTDVHTQWPGGRTREDPVVRQFLASQGPMAADSAAAQRLDQVGLAALLDKVGPAVLIAHSAGGPAAFLAADARADLVLALIACEPLGPPFVGAPGMPLAWGVANAPLTYDPPVGAPDEFMLRTDDTAAGPLTLQCEPVRRLVNLARMPIMLVTGEASPFRGLDVHIGAFLEQAGCTVWRIRLWECGFGGNGHGFVFERNNAGVLEFLLSRLGSIAGLAGSAARIEGVPL